MGTMVRVIYGAPVLDSATLGQRPNWLRNSCLGNVFEIVEVASKKPFGNGNTNGPLDGRTLQWTQFRVKEFSLKKYSSDQCVPESLTNSSQGNLIDYKKNNTKGKTCTTNKNLPHHPSIHDLLPTPLP